MKRAVDLNEISDGSLYGANDMVRADCGGCTGCSACCRGMGSSVILDPLDIYRLCAGLKCDFDMLLAGHLELNVVDAVILPNLKMTGPKESCSFLSPSGRCGIHAYRPGICRLFPLGRYYENGTLRYFLQVHECKKENRAKIKVRKWLDMPDLKRYEKFVTDWHYFLNDAEAAVAQEPDPEIRKGISLYLLQNFYRRPYGPIRPEQYVGEKDFYEQFDRRLAEARENLAIQPETTC